MTARDIVMGAAGGTADKTYVEDVFSTYLYTGDGGTQTITNGINLSKKGGLVIIKSRTNAAPCNFVDSARGIANGLYSEGTSNQGPSGIGSFLTTGYTATTADGNIYTNNLGNKYVSWTFAKQPKFFDVVTYTGDGATTRTINHSLGASPGMVIVKAASISGAWKVLHRSTTSSGVLNTTAAFGTSTTLGGARYKGYISSATSTSFDIAAGGTNVDEINYSGASYVAYVFGHDTTTDSLIKCASYSGTGSTVSVNLGWEPQFVMIKNLSGTGNWRMFDNMREVSTGYFDAGQFFNANASVDTFNTDYLSFTSSGFDITGTASDVNTSGSTYIYMAIRRGPMKTPTDGTKVFRPVVRQGSGTTTVVNTTITPDLVIHKNRGNAGGIFWLDRLRDAYYLRSDSTSGTSAEAQSTGDFPVQMWDNQTGYDITGSNAYANSTSYSYIDWVFKRAPGFFDIVCYAGTGSGSNFISHNLTTAPELIVVKNRTDTTNSEWSTWHKDFGLSLNQLYLNSTAAAAVIGNISPTTLPTSNAFEVGYGRSNASGKNYVAYLFASCPGVSKVGTYTGTGTTQQINCGFTAGARFVMIKRTDSTGDWYVWDTARGLVTGNDPYLLMNSTAAEVTTTDYIDPYSAGFELSSTAPASLNASGGTYIYLAIA